MSDSSTSGKAAPPTKKGEALSPQKTPVSIMIRLSIMMFLQFFVWGAWYVAVAGFLAEQKMGGFIAAAFTVAPIAAIIAPLTVGLIADRVLNSEMVLGLLFLIGALLLWIAPTLAQEGSPSTFFSQFTHPMMVCLLLYMICYMPTLGLTASLSFNHLANGEKEFPVVRVLGTIGWIAGGWIMWTCRLLTGESSKLADAQAVVDSATAAGDADRLAEATQALDLVKQTLEFSDNSSHIFHAAAIASAVLGVYCFTLPKTEPPSLGQPISLGKIFGLDAWSLLKQPAFFVFALASFLICIPLAGYYGFGYNYVSSQGVTLFGTSNGAMSTGQMSEIIFMLLMPLCFARLGVKNMLAIGMLAWVVRYGIWGWAFSQGALSATALIFIGILLHGICYDFFFVTGMIYTDKKAPPAIRSQAQSLIVMLTQGLGLGIGAQLFGQLEKYATEGHLLAQATQDPPVFSKVFDYSTFWYVPAIFAGAVLVIFFVAFWDREVDDQ